MVPLEAPVRLPVEMPLYEVDISKLLPKKYVDLSPWMRNHNRVRPSPEQRRRLMPTLFFAYSWDS